MSDLHTTTKAVVGRQEKFKPVRDLNPRPPAIPLLCSIKLTSQLGAGLFFWFALLRAKQFSRNIKIYCLGTNVA